jgi:hypothetical protein
MAINIPIITSLEDTGIKNAKAAFNDFKSAVSNAEGGMGKFKAGAGAAFDAVKANAANFAMAAGAALISFAVQGIKAFQDLALAAGKFADATGLTVEDASRWKEVAGDIGVGSDSIQTGISKMNKVLGTSPQLFKDLGIEIAKTDSGAMDVNGTFLNVIQRLHDIKDPAERAKVATQLLGKGWTDMAELIQVGAEGLRTSLGEVSESKTISPEELKKAKEYRKTMDELGDKFQDVAIAVGQYLVPKLTAVLQIVTDITDAVDKIPDPLLALSTGGIFGAPDGTPGWAQDKADATAKALADAKKVMDDVADDGMQGVIIAADRMATALMDADNAWKILIGNLDQEVALDNAKEKLKDLEAAAKRAFGSGAQADIDAYEEAAADFVGMLAAISDGMDDISSKEILIRYKTQGPAAALDLANYLVRGAEYGGKSAEDALTLAGISTLPARANGGPVMSGTTYLVGERGPELFTPSSSGNITPNGAMGGNTITVNVNGGDPNQIVAALRRYISTNGTLPLAVR